MNLRIFVLCSLLIGSFGTVLLHGEEPVKIVALVIGNNRYVHAEDQLDTPVNDARLIKATLEALPGGADVALLVDATKKEMERALYNLKMRAEQASKSSGATLALVYFSGHGTEDHPDGFAQDETFVLPVDAEISDVNDLPTSAVALTTILTALKDSPVTTRAVILDCCRSGAPRTLKALARRTKSFGDLDERVKNALGKAVRPDATLVAFAASPGRKAAAFLREADENSPFTYMVAEQFKTGAGNLRDLIETAAKQTEQRTERRQVPYVSYTGAASAIRQIFFRRGVAPLLPDDRKPDHGMAAERTRLAEERRAFEDEMKRAGVSKAASLASIIEQGAIGKVIEIRLPGDLPLKFCYCPPGSFTMGSPDTEDGRYVHEQQVQVRISRGFWMAQTELTQEQWMALMGSNPSSFKGYKLPVEGVDWQSAQEYIAKLNETVNPPVGWKFALPTEAQWEYACRAGTATAFSFGNSLSKQQANFDSNKTSVVGTFPKNRWGLYDMHGNVWEWCSGFFTPALTGGTDPESSASPYRVTRGGGCYRPPMVSSKTPASFCRSAIRGQAPPHQGNGFRPALLPSTLVGER